MRPLPLVAALLMVAFSGCIVPESMTDLREQLGYASVDVVPVLVEVKARATTLTPRVNEPVDFEAVVEGIDPSVALIAWDLGGSEVDGPLATRSWSTPGAIEVVVTARAPTGEFDTDRLLIEVHDNRAPRALIVVEDRANLVEGKPVVLTATSSTDADGDALTYAWEFDGGQPVVTPVVERPFTAGVHRVKLTASDGLDETVAFDAFGIALPLAAKGHVSPLEETVVQLVFAAGDGASGLAVTLTHTTLAGIDDVDLVLVDPGGQAVASSATEPSMLASSAGETLVVDAARLAPGTYTLEARLVRGTGADVAIEGVLTYSPLSAAG